MNWTAALAAPLDCPLAKISNTDELCDAQTAIRNEGANFWTALKEENGSYFWGNINGTIQPVYHLNSDALLDKTEQGNCYVISKADTIKLKSKDCSTELNGILCSYSDDLTGLSW